MSSEQVLNFGEQPVGLFVCKGDPYFKGVDVASSLAYSNARQALLSHVSDENKQTLQQLLEIASKAFSEGVCIPDPLQKCVLKPGGSTTIFINESGVYELAFRSNKPEAKLFRKWVVNEVLPEIRKTGRYVRNKQVSLMNEKDLHFKVVDFIKKYWPESLRIAGLGELQDSVTKRVEAWHKGYSKGQPDLILLNRTKERSGLVIELKTPLGTGRTSPEQQEMLKKLEDQGFETLVSEDYDEILVSLVRFMDKARAYALSKTRVRRSSLFSQGSIKKTMAAVGSISRVVSQSFSSPSDSDEAMEPAAKRAKVEVKAFDQLSLEKFAIAQKNIKGQIWRYPAIDGEAIHVNLTPSGWLSTAWGFDFSGRYEMPSFLGGPAPEREGAAEGLKLEVALEPAQATFLQALDDAAKSAAAEIFPKAKWNPLVKDQSSFKVKVVLKGGYELCKLAVAIDDKVSRGEGYDFLKNFNRKFARSQVKLAVKVKSLYCVKGSAGISLEASQLVLKPGERYEKLEEELFGDEELLA